VGGARLNPVRQEGRGPWRWVPHDERGRGGPDVLSAPESTIGAGAGGAACVGWCRQRRPAADGWAWMAQ
jgi:hypothetical protein